MDLIFNCPHCEQELAVDASGAGSEIECPSCNESLVIPDQSTRESDTPQEDAQEKEEAGEDDGTPKLAEPLAKNPISTSAGAKIHRHFEVPQHEGSAAPLIEKPLATLEASAKGSGQITVKTFRRSDCVEVGKDHFDEVVSKFVQEVGEENLIAMHPITYSHQDLASHQWISDYGMIIVYKA